ncbi:MAG: class I SAM-dependent methyltransferase [Proteobacteria bacterium]|nr:class I SAM-dependent methyltransferase [Pseudomonadota bacterium]
MNRSDVWWEIPDLPKESRVLDLGAEGPAVSFQMPGHATYLTSDIRLYRQATSENIKARLITDIPDVGPFDDVVYGPAQREAKLRVFELIDGAFKTLARGGRIFLAGRKNRGVESYMKRLVAVFGNVSLIGRAKRVRVYKAVKRSNTSHTVPVDPWTGFTTAFGESTELTFRARAGVFSSDGFDPGSRLLADTIGPIAKGRILDVGCGSGTIGIALTAGKSAADLSMVDVNALAVACAEQNARSNGLGERSVAVRGDLYDAFPDQQFDLIVSNPPFHEGNIVSLPLIEEAPQHLSGGGRLVLVVMRDRPYRKVLERVFGQVEVLARDGVYRILAARDPR